MGAEIIKVDEVELLPAEIVPVDIDRTVSASTRERIEAAVPVNTKRAYARQWETFTAWCSTTGRTPLPATAETVAEYVSSMCDLDRAPATIDQAIAVIRRAHRDAGLEHQPDTAAARLVLRAYRRQRAESGQRPRQAPPAVIDVVRALVAASDPKTDVGLRDCAMIVLGFAMMGRRSELIALMISDVRETPDGLLVLVRSSKTDQDATGEEVAIPYGSNAATCPVRVVRSWLARLADHGIIDGPLLRSVNRHGQIGQGLSGGGANKIIRTAAQRANLPNAESITMHSLRAGGATSAYKAGAPISAITRQGRWAPGSPVVLGYIRAVDQWKDNPMAGVGL
ncbi:site-specific integrase [Frankia tisae]|uniref:site-specific integrase n=1 Tax=Frankia tisae TaxID=2950104 RepID=UPI0021C1628E|nr:site-specific integrase [Frankia tisae]